MNRYRRNFGIDSPFFIIVGLNILVFMFAMTIKTSGSLATSMHLAKINSLVATGEYWRLFTAMFAHADMLHILFNSLGIYIFSRITLPFYGNVKMVTIYFISGIAGSVASYVLTPAPSIGASGALFGIIGANLYLYKRNPFAYKMMFSKDVFIIVIINVVHSFVGGNIDAWAHLGGLVGGFVSAAAVGVLGERVFTRKRILNQFILLVLIIAPFAVHTYNLTKDPGTYFSAYFYKDALSGRKAAIKILEKGLKKFPDDYDMYLQKRNKE